MKNFAIRVGYCALAALTITVVPAGALLQFGEPAVLEALEVSGGDAGSALIVSLRGSGQLKGTLQEVSGTPFRVFVDLKDVVPGVSAVTPVGLGHVERIRVALNRSKPPVTRVVLDLSSEQPYRLEEGPEAEGLRIVIGNVGGIGIRGAETTGGIATDDPTEASETDYAAWFTSASKRADRLLDAVLDDTNVTKWSVLAAEVDYRTPPPAFGVAHNLLRTVVRLGTAAASVDDERPPSNDPINRSTAVTGARLLLSRARMIVDGEPTPPPHAPGG